MSPTIRWTRIPLSHSLPRSSHSCTVIGTKAYIFGGEIKAREPVESVVHVIDIHSGAYDQVQGKGDVPSPRVGHVAARVRAGLAVFGGRGGSAMAPIEESGSVHLFDPAQAQWTRLSPSSAEAPFPTARSYHCASSSPSSNMLYVHAGCGVSPTGGTTRSNDMWAFDLDKRAWAQLPDGPGEGRGGAAIIHVDGGRSQGQGSPDTSGTIWRFGGYNGKTELGGSIEYLPLEGERSTTTPSDQWKTVPFPSSANATTPNGPPARSVAALVPGPQGTVLAFGGEGKPSPTGGHDAAGNFWDDAWLFSPDTQEWTACRQEGQIPSARGWFAADSAEGGEIVLWGGLDGANERLGDGFVGVITL